MARGSSGLRPRQGLTWRYAEGALVGCRELTHVAEAALQGNLGDRDGVRVRQEKELSFGEKRLLEQARMMLVRELALAQRQKEDRVGKTLDQMFV